MPIYESAGKGRLTSRWFRRVIHATLENLAPDLPDPVPACIRRQLNLISPREALRKVHWPDPGESLQDLQSARTPAHIRPSSSARLPVGCHRDGANRRGRISSRNQVFGLTPGTPPRVAIGKGNVAPTFGSANAGLNPDATFSFR